MRFWGRGRPQDKPPFLLWAALRDHRMALILLGMGFFSVFLIQAVLVFQLVLGAPVFEELVKFGLALALVAPLRARHRLPWLVVPMVLVPACLLLMLLWVPGLADRRNILVAGAVLGLLAAGMAAMGFGLVSPRPWLVQPARVLTALAVGGSFGLLEHNTGPYVDEDSLGYASRVLFHSSSTGLSMVLYALLEPMADVRVRWFATGPSILIHYLNNAWGVVGLLVLVGLGADEGTAMDFARGWSFFLVASLVVLFFAGPLLGRPVRRLGARLARGRLNRLPPHWQALVDRRRAAAASRALSGSAGSATGPSGGHSPPRPR